MCHGDHLPERAPVGDGRRDARFPIANEPSESPLRAAGSAALQAGATVLRWGASAEADVLLSAAEERCTGVHVRPQRGAACVFWTMDETGVDAAASNRTQHAKVFGVVLGSAAA